MKSFKIIRMVLTVVDVVCLLAVLFVPALEAAKHNFLPGWFRGLPDVVCSLYVACVRQKKTPTVMMRRVTVRRIFRRNYFLRGISGTGNKISV